MTADATLEERIAHLVRDQRRDDAVAALIDGYGAEIFGFLVALLHTHDDADDAFSVFAEHVVTGIASFRGQSSFRTWAYAIARHAAYNLQRNKRRERARRVETTVDKAVAAVRSATADFVKTEVKDAVRALRASLSADEQELLTLRVDRAFSWSEIVRILDPDVIDDDVAKKGAALRKQFERTKAKLRALAEERGIKRR